MSDWYVGWVHLTEDDLRNAREAMRAFFEDAIDELGFGSLQDAYSDLFYPATSTLMVAPRYLFFIAAIYRYLLGKGLVGAALRERSEKMQQQMRHVLRETEALRIVKENLRRWPSAAYWSALQKLRFLRGEQGRRLSEREYQAWAPVKRKAAGRSVDPEQNENAPADEDQADVSWDLQLPPFHHFLDNKGAFRPETNYRLTVQEARYLYRAYRDLSSELAPEENTAKTHGASLLSWLLTERVTRVGPHVWTWCRRPTWLRPYLDDARRVSLLARGMTLMYQGMLVDECKRRGLEAPTIPWTKLGELWWPEARRRLADWDFDTFRRRAVALGGYRDDDDLQAWRARMLDIRTWAGLWRDEEARRILADRELRKRPTKARLRNPNSLDQWRRRMLRRSQILREDEPTTLYQLRFRHRIGRQFVQDVVAGLLRPQKTDARQ